MRANKEAPRAAAHPTHTSALELISRARQSIQAAQPRSAIKDLRQAIRARKIALDEDVDRLAESASGRRVPAHLNNMPIVLYATGGQPKPCDLVASWSYSVKKALLNFGLDTVGKVLRENPSELLPRLERSHGVGPARVRAFIMTLVESGLSLGMKSASPR